MESRRRKALVSLLVLAVALAAVEIVLQATWREEIPVRIPVPGSSYVFALNPDHPEVNALGLRGPEIAAGKGKAFRILVLGDSVAFGEGVEPEEAFPAVLERELSGLPEGCQVLNASVRGYTAWNELAWFRERGARLAPDLVLVAACLNDVVDPLLHWYWEDVPSVPEEAIPNPEDHRARVVPIFEERRARLEAKRAARAERERSLRSVPLLGRSATWWYFVRHLVRFLDPPETPPREGPEALEGRLTLEDRIRIDVLRDPESPEWRWLRRTYDALAEEVAKSGSRLALVVVPLRYQVGSRRTPEPQEHFQRYGADRGVPCLDLLERFRSGGVAEGESFFRGWVKGYYDIWHLSAPGHRVTAGEVARFLEREHLVPRRSRPGRGT